MYLAGTTSGNLFEPRLTQQRWLVYSTMEKVNWAGGMQAIGSPTYCLVLTISARIISSITEYLKQHKPHNAGYI